MEKKKSFWLWTYLKPNQTKLFLSIVTAILGTVIGLVPYYIIAVIIKNILEHNDSIIFYVQMCGYGLLAFGGKVLFDGISTGLSHTVAFKTLKRIREDILIKISRMPLGDIERRSSGSLKSTIFERINSIEVTIAHIIPELIGNLIPPIVLVIGTFVIDWRLGLASLITLPIGLFFMSLMMIGADKKTQECVDATKNLNDTAVEYISGIEEMKVFGQDEKTYKRFVGAANAEKNSFVGWMKSANVFFCAMIAITPATLIGVVPIGAILLDDGIITLFEMIIAIILCIAMVEPLIVALSKSDDIRKSEIILKDVKELLDAKELYVDENPIKVSGKSLNFNLNNITFSYDDKKAAIKDINLEIKQGDKIALVGPSGSGKSTIAKLISRYWDVNDGDIELNGVNIKKYELSDYMNYISYVSQDNYLFNDTVMNNIRMGSFNKNATDEEVIEIAKKSGCHDFIMGLENGYETIVGEGGRSLSGGERQRICIARAMMKNAPIVILDEATSYTDPESEKVLQDAISALVKDKTLIIIAHRLSTIVECPKICCLESGRIVETGNHESLLKNKKTYYKLWESHIATRDSEVNENV